MFETEFIVMRLLIGTTLDPDMHSVRGSETITYTINNPHSVQYLWIQLDQNLFRPGSRGSGIQPPDSFWRGSFPGGGYTIPQYEAEPRNNSWSHDSDP